MSQRVLPWCFSAVLILAACQAAPPAAPAARVAAPAVAPVAAAAAPVAAGGLRQFRAVVWTTDAGGDLAAFERGAVVAKAAGATHMVINDSLPRSVWEYETPGDPYPGWYVNRPSLFKIFTPAAMKGYIPQAYTQQVMNILVERAAVLRRHGLQGAFHANEPQVLPEAVFRDHPEWRGPRVDQENRSTAPHFAACVDEAEVLALYRESMGLLLKKCPEITMFRFVTTDAGAGLCWSPGLYPGANGPTHCKDRPMADRVEGLMAALHAGAADAGVPIEVRLLQIEPEEWMIPTFTDPEGISHHLPAGSAINNFEGPGGTPYISSVGWNNPGWSFFNPVHGVPNPAAVLPGMHAAVGGKAGRIAISAPRGWDDLYARMFEKVRAAAPATSLDDARILQELAAEEAGPAAEDLVQMWRAIAKANEIGDLLKFAYPSTLGAVHQRWLTRPFVPYPAELKPEEKGYYRKYLFQAKGETQADDLVDLQAMRLYKGWAGRMWVLNVYSNVDPLMKTARARLAAVIKAVPAEKRGAYEALDLRLQAYALLCVNARNAVNYQAVLDYIKERQGKGAAAPDENPPLGSLETWDRKMILEIARGEIDNTAALMALLKKHPDLIEHAATKEGEDITLLGPDVVGQLQMKLNIMNAHWQDYNRLTTVPNP